MSDPMPPPPPDGAPSSPDAAGAGAVDAEWLELAVECDTEAVEPISELFARYGYNQGVVIEQAFSQDPDGDNLAVDASGPVVVRTYVAAADCSPETIMEIRAALWHLGQLRPIGDLAVIGRREDEWANAWKSHFRAHRIGHRVTVRAPWHDYHPEPDEVVIELDPGMAFGTGLHPSTRLALLAVEEELRPGMTVLDVGAGSGILTVAAARLGAARVDAVDIEPVAVRETRENAARNALADRVRAELGSVGPDEPFHGEYDLVVANIIARVLVDLAPHLAAHVAEGGRLILSGIIDSREPLVREAMAAERLVFERRAASDDWVSLVYRR